MSGAPSEAHTSFGEQGGAKAQDSGKIKAGHSGSSVDSNEKQGGHLVSVPPLSEALAHPSGSSLRNQLKAT